MLAEHRRLWRWLTYGAIAIAGAVLAYYELFSQFAYYDDEGYLLTSVSEFLHGGALYDDVYSQYGPLYHELFGAFFGLTGIEVTNDHGRIVVLVIWVATATGLGLIAERLTKRLSLGAITQIAAFGLLIALRNEPMHPIGLTTALIVAILAAAAWPGTESVKKGAIWLGALCGALVMVKVNMGAFAIVAVLVAALMGSGRRWAPWVAGALLVVVPLGLLGSNLNLRWVQDLLFVEVAAAIAIVVRAWPVDYDHKGPLPYWLKWFIGSIAAVCALSLLVILALGSSPSGLIHALLLDPPKQTSVLRVPPPLPAGALAWSLAALVAAFACRKLSGTLGASWLPVRAIARIAAALIIWLSILGASPISLGSESGPIALAMLLAWIAAVAPPEVEEGELQRFARLAITLIVVVEVLQAYPVAVSQLGVATMPFALLGAVILSDGLRLLELWGRTIKAPDRKGLAAATATVLVVAGALVGLNAILRPLKDARSDYRANVPLNVHGAGRIHVPRQQAQALEQMTAALKSCHQFVSIPGSTPSTSGRSSARRRARTPRAGSCSSTPSASRRSSTRSRTTPGCACCATRRGSRARSISAVIASWSRGRSSRI